MIINNKNTNIYEKIDLLLWFMWGFSCLIIVPYIDLFSISIQLMEVFNLLVFASIFLKISLDKRENNSKRVNISLIIILLLYALAVFWPIGGVITVYHLGYIPRLSTFLIPLEIVGIGILPDIENLISVWKGKWNPESMTVTFALMGGIVTLLAFTICIGICLVITFIKYLKGPWNKQYLSYFIILLSSFVLGMGYGIDNHIVFIMIFLMIVHICTNHS